jgi:alpha,alpha-trehalase
VVHLWADALNESIGFSARDTTGAPASLEWGSRAAVAGSRGVFRTLTVRLRSRSSPVVIGHILLGSMRVERDFQYQRGHLGPLDAPRFVPRELLELVENLGRPEGRVFRTRLEPEVTVARSDTTWAVWVTQTSLDGQSHLWLTLRGDPRRTTVDTGLRSVTVRSRGPGPIDLVVEVATDGPALTPLRQAAIFNDAFRRFFAAQRTPRLERQVRGFELLASREKLMAGLPNFATYFGRDMLMTALLMEPVWADTMPEFVIAAALAKLNPAGEVSHEEALGGQAIREHAAVYNTTRNPAVLTQLSEVRENYQMVDDDFQLPVVAARYFANPAVPAQRKRRFLARWRGPLLKNLAFVANAAALYAREPVATNLVSFRRLPDSSWHAGSWRDSRVGYAGGRFAFDVNAVWVPAALRAVVTIDSTLKALGLRGVPEAGAARSAAEAWRNARRHFEVALPPGEVESRVRAKLQSLPAVERAHWERVLARSGFPADTLRFYALSLDSAGRPIPVMSTDPAMLLLLERLTPEQEAEMLQPFVLPYPVGLMVEGVGPLVANDAYASPAVWRMFEDDHYHSPRVVWGREVNLVLAALARRGRSPVLDRIRETVERSGMGQAELWTYRIEPEGARPVRYGSSSDVQLWNLTDLSVQYLLSRLPYDPAHDLGPLFHDVQMAGIFSDSKTFVDARPLLAPAVIRARYAASRDSAGFDLKAFVARHFELPEALPEVAHADTSRTMEQHIRALWPTLIRGPPARASGTASTLIPLPKPYVVPGGRFREVYYWDSYFTMLGLIESGRIDLVESMLDNFAHLIVTVGHVPNGNRTYYLSRSQPPYFAAMVGLYAAATDTARALRYLDALEREHAFWMEGPRVVRLPDGSVLNRYWDDRAEPRPESYREDYRLAEGVPEDRREALYRNIRASAESGWDFSSRWMRDPADLKTLETTDLAPVDLNSLLYHAEQLIAALRRFRGRAGDVGVAERFDRAADVRRRALLTVAYDSADGFFYDVRWRTGERVRDRPTLAAAAPLYFGLATAEQGRAVAVRLEREFLKGGGFVTTLVGSGQQWDGPNGWAPLQWLAIQGVRRYGRADLADTAAARWLALNRRVYAATGRMMEKYDVVALTRPAGGGEYPTQDGFGWTNGVAAALLRGEKP